MSLRIIDIYSLLYVQDTLPMSRIILDMLKIGQGFGDTQYHYYPNRITAVFIRYDHVNECQVYTEFSPARLGC